MFIFDRCQHSQAVGTPAKYEQDIQQATTIMIILQNGENIQIVVVPPPQLYEAVCYAVGKSIIGGSG